MRILIADDDPVGRTFLTRILIKWGHDVVPVADGDAAWNILQAEDPPRMVILDWMMPGVNGVEICARLREDALRPYTYVILLTAKSHTHDLIEGLESGADTYLTKPVGPPELRVRLRTGERILTLESRLRYRIQSLEGELQRAQPDSPSESGVSGRPEHTAAPAGAPDPLRSAPGILQEVLAGLNVEPSLIRAANDGEPVFLARTAIVLRRTEEWILIGMQLGRQAAESVYGGMVGEPPRSDSDLLDALAEVLNMCQGALKLRLEEEGWQPMTPVLPTAARAAAEPIPEPEGTSIQVAGGIRFVFSGSPARVATKSAGELCPRDILADPICDPDNHQIVFLSRGIALNPRYIERIHDLVASGRVRESAFPVVVPLSSSY